MDMNGRILTQSDSALFQDKIALLKEIPREPALSQTFLPSAIPGVKARALVQVLLDVKSHAACKNDGRLEVVSEGSDVVIRLSCLSNE